jgi:two-component system cell cycle sensor histidine kinase/response regulator CckA
VVRDFTTRVLERAGYRVVAADSGDAALEILDRVDEPFLAVVTDVVMPGMSGTALAELVLERFPAVGVVLLSGYTAEVLDLTRALGRGATFVGKPFTPAELIEAIQAAVASIVEAG